MAQVILAVLLVYVALSSLMRLETWLERQVRIPSIAPSLTTCTTVSVGLFKRMRILLTILASMESGIWAGGRGLLPHLLALIIAVAVLGVVLRLWAIASLGSLWSYDVEIKPGHYVVRTGAYRLFRHPAYFGNIYLPAILLACGARASSLLSLLFIVFFGVSRACKEDALLAKLTAAYAEQPGCTGVVSARLLE